MDGPDPILLFYDYVDPASFLLEHRLRSWTAWPLPRVVLEPLELRPPREPMVDPLDPDWSARWDAMVAEAARLGLQEPWRRPEIVPRTRKAHELAFLARERGCFPLVHEALFRSWLEDGKDLGRVDVLVALGAARGLDRMDAKVTLDVDRHGPEVEEARLRALRLGVSRTPTLHWRGRFLVGYPDETALRSFLDPATPEGEP